MLPHHLVPQDAVAIVAVGTVHPKLTAKQRHAAILLKGRGFVEQYAHLRDGSLLTVIAQRRADPRALQGRGQHRHARPLVGKRHAAQRHQGGIGPASALVGEDKRLVEVKRVHEVVIGKDRHLLQVAEAVPVGRTNDDCVLLIHLPNRVDHLLLNRVPSRVANAVRLVEDLVVELSRMRGKMRGKLGPHRHQHVANVRRRTLRRIKRVVVQDQMQPQLVSPIRDLIEKVVEQGIDAVGRRPARHGVQVDRQAHYIAAKLLNLLKVGPAKLGKMHVLRTGRLQPIGQIDAPLERDFGAPRSGSPTQKHETNFSHYLTDVTHF